MKKNKKTRRDQTHSKGTMPFLRGHDASDHLPSIKKLHSQIIGYFKAVPNTPVTLKQVATALGSRGGILNEVIEEILYSLVEEKIITHPSKNTFLFRTLGKGTEGTFVRHGRRGDNSFIPDGGGEPIRVSERLSRNAMDGDRVLVQFMAKRKGQPLRAEVVKVLERKVATFVGKLSIRGDIAFLITESNKLANDILIPSRHLNGAKHGEKVVVKVISWDEGAKNPIGEVIDIIGMSGQNDTEMHAILAEFGLPYIYPERVEQAADAIDAQSAYDAKYQREDFREVPTLTIDPREAKDFDDALSFRRLDDGLVEVGVHIADVTAYVHEGDIIDQEAQKRATSVYLVDRTIPMLPERLCNDLCSLRPNEDRPAYSVIFTMNEVAEVLAYRIVRTVIHSNARLAYEEAQEIIEGADGPYRDEIMALHVLAQQLRTKRFENNAISFERSELKFEIDASGKPIGVKLSESKEANKLIEEFMLLANRTVAAHIGKIKGGQQAPVFVYRVHDLPDEEKLQELSEFVMGFGYKLKHSGSPATIAKSINKLLADVKGKPEENLIQTVAIRTMAKAFYTTDNVGHYGLGFEYYTHFTSPIRRHPDMMVHRLLTHYIQGGASVSLNDTEEQCKHDSSMENTAAQAERASLKYKQVEYMQERMGEVFDGVISGVTEWGLFVQLNDNGCEGLVPIRELDDDFYEFDPKNYRLIGFNHRRRYSLGDALTVRVARADLERKQLDFELA